jgi:TPP-dependent indolepyruvate ferredoxin oxidoreductase alpha subunit
VQIKTTCLPAEKVVLSGVGRFRSWRGATSEGGAFSSAATGRRTPDRPPDLCTGLSYLTSYSMFLRRQAKAGAGDLKLYFNACAESSDSNDSAQRYFKGKYRAGFRTIDR